MNWGALLAYYQRLSPRERMLVGLAGGVVLVMALYLLVWEPLETGRLGLARRIQIKTTELQEMQHMREVYLDLLNQFELRQKIIDRADPKFSLFPHIEATVGQVVGRDKITSMNPQNKELGGGAYREESVEIKLTGVTLEQLTDLMYKIEKSPQPLRFTRMQVKKRVREPSTFDLTATVSMLRAQQPPPGAESGGGAGA
ncbi:type II secretion system protein M [bacterium]|nr:type II secretion system protein M [bacterium]